MPEGKDSPLSDETDAPLAEVETLKRQIRRLKLEKDVLRWTMEITKKDPGVDPKNLTNKEKAALVGALRNEHPLKDLLSCLGMAQSSYFYHRKIASFPGKYEKLRHRIIELFNDNRKTYGYRRIHALLTQKENVVDCCQLLQG